MQDWSGETERFRMEASSDMRGPTGTPATDDRNPRKGESSSEKG